MLPLYDSTRSYSFPFWIVLLIALNAFFYFTSTSKGDQHYVQTLFEYGTIPARFFQPSSQPLRVVEQSASDQNPDNQTVTMVDQSKFPNPLITLFTSMFLHGELMHLLGNMWFLWLFGDNVEDRLGKFLFPIFYIVCGILAGIMHVALLHDSTVPAIGASGAIAGVMGAYVYMFPRARVASLIWFAFFVRIIQVPAPFYLGVWFLLQLFGGFAGENGVAVWAHVGGFLAGLILAWIFSLLGLVNWSPDDRGMLSPTQPKFYD